MKHCWFVSCNIVLVFLYINCFSPPVFISLLQEVSWSIPQCTHWPAVSSSDRSLIFCVCCSGERGFRQPATQTRVCPVWCCTSPRQPGTPWRAAHPARNRPATTPLPLRGTCLSSPGSDVLPSLPAGYCSWPAGWGPCGGADPVWAARFLAHAGWAFGRSHTCGGACTGLQGGNNHIYNQHLNLWKVPHRL